MTAYNKEVFWAREATQAILPKDQSAGRVVFISAPRKSAGQEKPVRLTKRFEVAAEPPIAPSVAPQLAPTILDGLARLMECLLEAEADHLCGAPRYARDEARKNYREVSYDRDLRTYYGKVSVSVPRLRWIHARPSMLKRVRRMEVPITEALLTCYHEPIRVETIQSMIETLWTIELPEALLESITQKLSAILFAWRENAGALSTPVAVNAVSAANEPIVAGGII